MVSVSIYLKYDYSPSSNSIIWFVPQNQQASLIKGAVQWSRYTMAYFYPQGSLKGVYFSPSEQPFSIINIDQICCRNLIIYLSSAALMMNTGPPAQDQQNFVRTSKFFSFYLDIYLYTKMYLINSRIWFGRVNSNFHFEDCWKKSNETVVQYLCKAR